MVARNEVAVPLNQKLPAVETTCVLKVSYLARQISCQSPLHASKSSHWCCPGRSFCSLCETPWSRKVAYTVAQVSRFPHPILPKKCTESSDSPGSQGRKLLGS